MSSISYIASFLLNFSCSGGKKRKYVTRQTMEVIIQ